MAIASPIPWSTVEDALYDWFSGATGLVTIFEEQDAPRPPYPYASISIFGPRKLFAKDEHRYSYDALQPPGEEIGIEVCGPREITVSCKVRVKQSDSYPSNHARDMMTRAQSSLSVPAVLDSLRLAGLSVVEEGDILTPSERVEDTWIGRATMDVRCGLSSSVTVRTGYIATVGVEPTLYEPDGVTEVDDDLKKPFEISIA